MHWTVILFLISLIINGIISYILRNSHYGDEPIIWILAGIVTIIPVLNIIATVFFIFLTIQAYSNGRHYK